MAEPTNVQHLVKQLMAGASPEENGALLDALMGGQVTSIFEKLKRDQAPTLLPIPTQGRVPAASGPARREAACLAPTRAAR